MAFRILSEQEVKLLTDKKRVQYQKALDLYISRTKFLAGLDAVENMEVQIDKPDFAYLEGLQNVGKKKFFAPEFRKENIRTIEKIEFADTKFDIKKNEAVRIVLQTSKPIVTGKKYRKPVEQGIQKVNIKNVEIASKEMTAPGKTAPPVPSLSRLMPNKKKVEFTKTFLPERANRLKEICIGGHKIGEISADRVVLPKVIKDDWIIPTIESASLIQENTSIMISVPCVEVQKRKFVFQRERGILEKTYSRKVQMEKKEFALPESERREKIQLNKCDIQKGEFVFTNQYKETVRPVEPLGIKVPKMKSCEQPKEDILDGLKMKSIECEVLFSPFVKPSVKSDNDINISKVNVDRREKYKPIMTEVVIENVLPAIQMKKKSFTYKNKGHIDKHVRIESVYVANMDDYLKHCEKTN